jgi:hypothetical protein
MIKTSLALEIPILRGKVREAPPSATSDRLLLHPRVRSDSEGEMRILYERGKGR